MRKRISATALLFQVTGALVALFPAGYAQIGCGFQADAAWQQRIASFKKTDTLRTLVIWAVPNNPPVATDKKLPVFWRQMWDSTQQLSVSRFYRDNSDRKYILNADPLGAPDSFCIRSTLNPVGFSGGRDFTRDVLLRADSFVNFATYDRDGDKFIEDGIFICIAYDTAHLGTHILGLTGGGALDTFVTRDSVEGVPIKIVANSGVTVRVPTREQGVQLACHEWGHLFGLWDYFAKATSDWWSSGSFTVMGYTGFNYRASPFSPFQNHKFIGWNQPVDVNATSYGQQIADYVPTKQFYRLKRTGSNEEYFEVSFHSVTQGEQSSFWEQQWPKEGVAIAHIVDTVVSPQSKAVKQYDLELPHGLRDTSGGTFGSNPNDSLGADSLDLFLPYWGVRPNIGSQTCVWPATISGDTIKYFDDKTNPSSRVYQAAMQRTPSKIAVEDIKINGATASADLILNAQYGAITSNTTFGPGLVSVIGDLRIAAGVTCSLAAGTTLKFQKRYDNLKGGAGDEVNMAGFIVDSTARLVIAGTAANPVKFLSSSPNAGRDDWQGIVVKNGATAVCSNAVIKNAFIGILIKGTTDTGSSLTRIFVDSCRRWGINAGCLKNNLRITGCRVESVSDDTCGVGIAIHNGCSEIPPPLVVAQLKNDTVRGCYEGIVVDWFSARIESCLVQAAPSGSVPSQTGIRVVDQYNISKGDTLPFDTVRITATCINGHFLGEHLKMDFKAHAELFNCNLISDSLQRSPVIIRNPIGQASPNQAYLKLRGSRLLNWGSAAVEVNKNTNLINNDLGTFPDVGNNTFTAVAGDTLSHFIRYTDTCISCIPIKAEGNWFGTPVPPTSRFSGRVDYPMWGTISQNLTWPAGNYTIWGDVTLESGYNWTLKPPTTIYALDNIDSAGGGRNSNKSEIISKGTLTALGTQADSIKFLSSNDASPTKMDWGGLFFRHPARGNFAFTRFSHAETLLSVRDTCTVKARNSTFTHFKTLAVYTNSGNVDLGAGPTDCGKNNFRMKTADLPGAKAVQLSTAPNMYAQGNYWDSVPPPPGWFTGVVYYIPYLTLSANPSSTCLPDGGGGGCGDGPGDQPCAKITVVDDSRPSKFGLAQNYPNPFNAATVIRFALPQPSRVELRIYNILGQVVRSFVEEKPTGWYEVFWDGRDENGAAVSSGIYLYQIRAESYVETKKMQLVK